MNVADSIEVDLRFGIIHCIECSEDFGDGGATLVQTSRISHESVEGSDEVGKQLIKTPFTSDFGGFGDNEVGAIAQGGAKIVQKSGSVGRRFEGGEFF